MPGDPVSELRAATRKRVSTLAKLDQARAEERDAIYEASTTGGLRQRDIVEITGYTREHVRRIVDQVATERGHG